MVTGIIIMGWELGLIIIIVVDQPTVLVTIEIIINLILIIIIMGWELGLIIMIVVDQPTVLVTIEIIINLILIITMRH